LGSTKAESILTGTCCSSRNTVCNWNQS